MKPTFEKNRFSKYTSQEEMWAPDRQLKLILMIECVFVGGIFKDAWEVDLVPYEDRK